MHANSDQIIHPETWPENIHNASTPRPSDSQKFI